MANKRMFSLSVVDTDRFLEMPISSRLLYYELGMRADDDGFVDNWKKILLFTGLKEDDMKVLIAKKFVLPFESGVIVIKHWRMNNYLQSDRKKSTTYQKELGMLDISKGGEYFFKENVENKGSNEICIQNADKVDTQYSIDKYSIDKNSILKEENNKKKKREKMLQCNTNETKSNKEETYFKNEDVNNIFIEFLQLRKKLKAVNSDRAVKLLINQLEKYDDEIKIKMIEQSILNSWKSVYELKATKKEKETFNDRLDRWAESRKED